MVGLDAADRDLLLRVGAAGRLLSCDVRSGGGRRTHAEAYAAGAAWLIAWAVCQFRFQANFVIVGAQTEVYATDAVWWIGRDGV